MASPLTVYGTDADGEIRCASTTYSTARSGGGTLYAYPSTNTNMLLGQQKSGSNYYCWEVFEGFDTSSVGADSTVTVVTLYIYWFQDYSTTDFNVSVYAYDWGASVDTGDWVPGATLAGMTLLAGDANSSAYSVDTALAFDEKAAFLSAIQQTGTTRLVLCSDRLVAGNEPSGNEYVTVSSVNRSGTSTDPHLYVEWTEAAAGIPKHSDYYYRRRAG